MTGITPSFGVARWPICPSRCGGTFWGDYEIIDETKRMTVRLRQFIERESLRRTFTSVAEEVGVDEKVIRNVFSEHVATLDAETKLVTPEWLGIDEIHLLGSPRAVLANLKERTVMELLRSRNKKPLWSFLNSKMDRRRVQLVTMDMWAPYRDLSRSTFPGATVVVDKFHVIRMASAALDAVRKEEGKKLSDSKRRQLMRGRHLVLRRSSDLAERDILLLQGMLAHLPRLKDAYEAKEAFYDWYARRRRSQGGIGGVEGVGAPLCQTRVWGAPDGAGELRGGDPCVLRAPRHERLCGEPEQRHPRHQPHGTWLQLLGDPRKGALRPRQAKAAPALQRGNGQVS